jgi:hypothetical protein
MEAFSGQKHTMLVLFWVRDVDARHSEADPPVSEPIPPILRRIAKGLGAMLSQSANDKA